MEPNPTVLEFETNGTEKKVHQKK